MARMLCLQSTPPGVAGQALSARVDDIGEDDVLRALEDDRTVPAVVTAPRPIRRGR